MKEHFGIETFDFIFLDHWKDRYLPDTKLMEVCLILTTVISFSLSQRLWCLYNAKMSKNLMYSVAMSVFSSRFYWKHISNLFCTSLFFCLLYLQDCGLLRKGTVLLADNVICPGVPDYLQYVRNSLSYKSCYFKSHLEYTKAEDGLEKSVFLGQRYTEMVHMFTFFHLTFYVKSFSDLTRCVF